MATKDELLAQAKDQGVDVPEGATKTEVQNLLDEHAKATETQGTDGAPEKVDGGDNAPVEPAGTTEQANSETDAAERVQPPVAANGLDAKASQEAYDANNSVSPVETPAEVKARELEDNADKVQTRKDEAVEADTKLGSSEEEAAAVRAGVDESALHNPKQNREPKNVFEESNQKVTEEERVAAQKVSDMSTSDREKNSPTPAEAAKTDAAQSAESNLGADIAGAIREATSGQKNFVIAADETVDPRFTIVRDKQTGEVMLRENETGHLSKVQLESLEEKEASIQGKEVEEV